MKFGSGRRSMSVASNRVLALCLYISEGQHSDALSRLQHVARAGAPAVQLVDFFPDEKYDRTGVTLASGSAGRLRHQAVLLLREALMVARGAGGPQQHPKVGLIDHVSCHHVQGCSTSDSAPLARSVAAGAASLGVPVHLYGNCNDTGASLASLRRQLGYFKQDSQQQALLATRKADVPADPEAREHLLHTLRGGVDDVGVCTIGNAPWVVGLNAVTDTLNAARAGAAAVSERAGGLAGVQAVALPRDDGAAEVACNVPVDAAVAPMDVVQHIEDAVSHHSNGQLIRSYRTNATPEDIINKVIS